MIFYCTIDQQDAVKINGLWAVESDTAEVSRENMFVEFTDTTVQFFQYKIGYLAPDEYEIVGQGDTIFLINQVSETGDRMSLGRIVEFFDSTVYIENSTRSLELSRISRDDFSKIMGHKWHQ
jgi:hypothetical protein